MWDKWSHSLIPTPTNPLSPLFAVLDPYWMEREHKQDRPYPISGPMFTEGTPWGAVLNPTIGRLIKPEREEHPLRLRHGIDIVSLLHNANVSIRERARDFTSTHYLSLKGKEVTAVDFNVWNAPTPDTSVMSVQATSGGLATVRSGTYGIYGTGGKDYAIGSAGGSAMGSYVAHGMGRAPGGGYDQNVISGFNELSQDPQANEHFMAPSERYTLPELARQALFGSSDYLVRHGDVVVNEEGNLGIYHNRPLSKVKGDEFNPLEKLAISSVVSPIARNDKQTILEISKQFDPYNTVAAMNKGIIAAAREHVDSPYAVDDNEGFTSTEKLGSFNPSMSMQLLDDPEAVADLMAQGNGASFVRNASTSLRLIGGIYGYMGSEAVGFGVHNERQIANSSDMYNFTRTFWDLNLGGFGGAVSEIGRRFIPNYQRLTKVNPLMNNMPDWLPERFRYGDAFCVSKNTLIETGEMQFDQAENIIVQQQLITHTGKHELVQNIAIRSIEENEKLYKFKISSISAVESVYSENHPILVYEKDAHNLSNSKGHIKQEISKLQKYNDIILCLQNGITSKKDVALITGINIDWLYKYLRDLQDMNMIENYKKDKFKIYPINKNLKLFDLNLIGHGLIWRKSKDIQVGDYVVYPLPEYVTGTVIVDLAQITDYPASDQYVYTSGQCKRQDFIEAYEWLENNASKLTHERGELKQILEQYGWDRRSYENAQDMIHKHKQPERMNRYIELTSELCYAIGLYLAEGYHNNSGISYALHIKEESLFNRSVDAFSNAGFNLSSYSFRRNNNTNGATGHINCKILQSFMDYLVGRLAHNKCLNDVLWNLQDDNLLRLLEGYIDGDGCNHTILSGEDNRKSYRVGISSCNLKLLLQIRKLALRFGVIFKIQKQGIPKIPTFINGRQVNTGINYNATITGEFAVNFAKMLWNINIDVPEWKRNSPKHSFIHGDYVFMRVQDITEYTKKDYSYVYGFEMQDDKSFCTAGVATHNTAIPKGEMRLPGAGYEAGNELHPDAYGSYGSFDRFKILADIAPHSPEYRLWREIAKKTVTDPELLREMKDIQKRAQQQGKKHDFYPYKLAGENLSRSNFLMSAFNAKDINYQNIVISEVLGNGKFRSGGTVYKMAGITVKGNGEETAQQVLQRYLTPGQEVTIAVDTNMAYATNKDSQKTINAAVFVQGESVNKLMMDSGDAVERKGDKSSAATLSQLSAVQQAIGLVSEIIGHADIPIISDQWLRVRSPLESYLAEQVYGTPYQSWAHPINTFLYPALERSIYERSIFSSMFSHVVEMEKTPEINIQIGNLPRLKIGSKQITRGPRQLMYMTSILANRNVLVGHAIANMIDASNSKLAVPISHALDVATGAAHIMIGGKSYFSSMTLGAYFGWEAARINEVTDKKTKGKYMAAGALIAAGFRALKHVTTGRDWVPDRVLEAREMEDYWDRLTFIKYQGLYHEAARRALDEEGVDIQRVLERTDEKDTARKEMLRHLKDIKKALGEAYGGKTNAMKDYLVKLVNRRISELTPVESMVEGGKYTQSAIIYKKAAEATMYGLKKGASWSSIISALPTNDREYFMEFVSETDPDKKKEILSIVSPALRRALQMSWGLPTEQRETNEQFFQHHYLPDSNWAGWNPEIDIADVEVKTIDNEGMNLSDFGFYESSLREPEVMAASPLPYKMTNRDINISSELLSLLKGKGLKNVKVNVTENNSMGPTEIIADIGIWSGILDQQRKVEDNIRSWI